MTPDKLRTLLAEATLGIEPPPLPASGTYTAEQVAAYESQHGHDIRLDCYPEYGCLVQSAAASAIFDLAPQLLDLWEAADPFVNETYDSASRTMRLLDGLKAALAALEGVKPE